MGPPVPIVNNKVGPRFEHVNLIIPISYRFDGRMLNIGLPLKLH